MKIPQYMENAIISIALFLALILTTGLALVLAFTPVYLYLAGYKWLGIAAALIGWGILVYTEYKRGPH